MATSRQAWVLYAIVFFGFVGNSLPYPIFAPLLLAGGAGDAPFWFGATVGAYPLG